MSAEELIEFLLGSFGAFLKREENPNWEWDKPNTESALQQLVAHGLIAREKDDRVRMTALGRLSGESGVEVESIIRLVSVLGNLLAESITDPTLITAAQLTVELDDVLFPINKRSTIKEPQHWEGELHRQRVAPGVMAALDNWVGERFQATLRAKKASACLFWISDTPLNQIEQALTQYGGAFDGAAGPIRSVSARTADLIETVTRVAELTHDKLDLADRRTRLIMRLQVGVSARSVELAKVFGNNLARGDYRKLANAGFATPELLAAATDDQLRSAVTGADSARKTQLMKEMLAEHAKRGGSADQALVLLPDYEP